MIVESLTFTTFESLRTVFFELLGDCCTLGVVARAAVVVVRQFRRRVKSYLACAYYYLVVFACKVHEV